MRVQTFKTNILPHLEAIDAGDASALDRVNRLLIREGFSLDAVWDHGIDAARLQRVYVEGPASQNTPPKTEGPTPRELAESNVQEINLEAFEQLATSIESALKQSPSIEEALQLTERIAELARRGEQARNWFPKEAELLHKSWEIDHDPELLARADEAPERIDEVSERMHKLEAQVALLTFAALGINAAQLTELNRLLENNAPALQIRQSHAQVAAQLNAARSQAPNLVATQLGNLAQSTRRAIADGLLAGLGETAAVKGASARYRGDGHHLVYPKQKEIVRFGQAQTELQSALQEKDPRQILRAYTKLAAPGTALFRGISAELTEKPFRAPKDEPILRELEVAITENMDSVVLSIYGATEGSRVRAALASLKSALEGNEIESVKPRFNAFLRRAEAIDVGLDDSSPRKAALLQHVRWIRAQCEITLGQHVFPKVGERLDPLGGLKRDTGREIARPYHRPS